MSRSVRRARSAFSLLAVGALAAGTLAATAAPASAEPADHLIINELYINGGSANATFKDKFVELYNPTDEAIDLGGLSVQYRSATGTGPANAVVSLTGALPPATHYLVGGGSNGGNGADLPTPDVTGGINPANGGGVVALVDGTSAITLPQGSVVGQEDVIDIAAWGNAITYETATATGPTATNDARSLNRTDYADTDNNAADFSLSSVGGATPTNSAGETYEPPPDPDPVARTIAEIQGTGEAAPHPGERVITTGVVTAAYPTGGFNGFVIQTAGSGGAEDATPGASDAIFVYAGSPSAVTVEVDDHVQVTGDVSEYFGLTQITPAGADPIELLDEPAVAPKATDLPLPMAPADREPYESMLVEVEGPFTVTNNYTTNTYAEIGLAHGATPLPVATEVADPRNGADDVRADNASKLITLDDGSSWNYTSSSNGANTFPQPWIDKDTTIRVGASATVTAPLVLDYRNNTWKLQPTSQMTAADEPTATFSGAERPAAPPAVGGDFTLGSFNVLNYFPTTGEEYAAATGNTCTYFLNSLGQPTTVNTCVGDAGPRGAANDAMLSLQEEKIVSALNALEADVVSLEEIENSAKFDKDRDFALATLVDALNADAGADTWAYAPSPATLPALDDEDVIRTAFIYKPAKVQLVGESTILVGNAAFGNAREPLAQAFRPVGGTGADTFVTIVNHFKSKSSGTDDGTGQGAANPDRVAQAEALISFADTVSAAAGTDKVFLTGDFNAYSMEDPIKVLTDASYADLGPDFDAAPTYQFGGEVGSLDHVLASPAARASVNDVGVWSINTMEPIAYEYSRYRNNVTDFHDPGPYRSSDHDPVLVGIKTDSTPPKADASVKASVKAVPYGKAAKVNVTLTPKSATGKVTLKKGNKVLGTANAKNGKATITIKKKALKPGRHNLSVNYAGNATTKPANGKVTLKVTKATSKTKAKKKTKKVIAKKTRAKLAITIKTPAGVPANGRVTVTFKGKKVGTAKVNAKGKATVRIKKFATKGKKKLVIRYQATPTVKASKTTIKINVKKRK